MLAPKDAENRDFGYNVLLWIDEQGAYVLNEQPVFYPWQAAQSLALDKAQGLPVSAAQLAKLEAYPKLLRWHINQQVKGSVP